MSTKTTIKRIALVSVAALGFGVLSVVPSNAAAQLDSIAVSASTGTQETTDTLTAGAVVVTATLAAEAGVDTLTVTASIVSGPKYVQPILAFKESTTATIGGSGTSAVSVAPTTAGSVTQATGKFNLYLNAPDTVGTYVVKLTPTGGVNAVATTVSITVTAKAAISTVATSATSFLNVGETSSATADAVVTAAKTASTTVAAATIKVTLKNAAGSVVTAESFTATVSGPGLLGSGQDTGTTIDAPNAVGRALTVHNGYVLQVFPDGTSGVSTITIKSAAGVELATETITFFGDVATIVATVKKPVLGGTTAVAGVLDIVAKDASGVVVSNLTSVNLVSSDTTKIAGAYTAVTPVWSATTQSYLVPVTPVAAGSANITVTTKASATATTGVDAAAVSVRVGGAAAQLDGLVVATDKAAYAPGELITLTVTPTDAAGLVLSDETYTVFTSAGIASSYAVTMVTGSLALAGAHNGGVAGTGTATGVATYKFYAPNIEGDLKLSWTRSDAFATAANDSLAGSVTVAIASPGVSAATDAANDALDAANAATDAANTAAEAADAATTAAQEASDAVAALSESVTKLIAGLQAQIKSLAAVVAKIAKKVKA